VGWFVHGSNPGEGRDFSASIQTGPGANPASHTMSTGSFLEVNRLEHGVNHPPLSSTAVKKEVELYPYSLSGL
jgi:hypothetical protein